VYTTAHPAVARVAGIPSKVAIPSSNGVYAGLVRR